jgi:hypothetical protein
MTIVRSSRGFDIWNLLAVLAGMSVAESPLQAQPFPLGATQAPSVSDAIHSSTSQAWADALVSLGRRTNVSPIERASLIRALRDTSITVRIRAAQVAGALGPLARPAIPELLVVLNDTATYGEAAFALGVVRERSERVLRAIFRAGAADGSRAASAILAITALGRFPLIRVSPPFAEELRAALRSPSSPIRALALRAATRANVPWARKEFTALLGTPEPDLRLDAAYAVAGLGPQGRVAEDALRRVSADSVEWIRAEIPALILQSRRPVPKASRPDACMHRASARGSASLATVVGEPPESLRDDARGPYTAGSQQVVVAQGTAFNFLLSGAPRDPGPSADQPAGSVDSTMRFLQIDLSHPVTGSSAVAMGLVRDAAAQFHAFFMRDSHGTVWNLRDIPIGATVWSDRTELSFFVNGRYHVMQFGPWALGACSEGYAYGARLNGDRTTPLSIHRESDAEFRFTAAPGSMGRLWEWARGQSPIDRGLYLMSFDLRAFPTS